MKNEDIASILIEIKEYLEIKKVPFKPRAYEKAAEVISGMEENVSDAYKRDGIVALTKIPGIGISIAEKIEELIKTGKMKYYEDLKKETPVRIGELTKISGLGPQSIKKLFDELHITTLEELEQAARAQKIRTIPGFREKTEEKIIKGIEFLKRSGNRMVLGFAMPYIENIVRQLKRCGAVERVDVAGSVRRGKETIGDIDILLISKKSNEVIEYLTHIPEIADIAAKGDTKITSELKNGLTMDIRIVPKASYGAALNYFTGSKDHNIALREIAIKHGYKLNEYGLFKGDTHIEGDNERDIYERLGLSYIEPELRENRGEIEAARLHTLPKLIGYGDLRGDLQVQTNWTDGSNSIEEMAEAGIKHGLEYILVTDHTKRLAVARGLNEERLQEQMKAIDEANKKFKGRIKILKGSECDILKDGTLDIRDDVLAKLDIVGASIHSYFNLEEKAQTERLIRAMENPHVDIIFHPTGRIINKRDAYRINMHQVIRASKRTRTVLEINAYPERADLKDEYIREAVGENIFFSIDSDAHSTYHFEYLRYGIAQARRGWASKDSVINTYPLADMLQLLKK